MLDDNILFYGFIILLFLLISAFFSAAETALTAISRARIFHLVMDGNRRAETVSRLRKNKESLIGAILLGNNAVNIAASAIATSLAIRLFGNNDTALAIVTVVMTLLVVIFAEILPKTYAIQNSERVSLVLAPAVSLLVGFLYPITHGIQLFIRIPFKLFGIDLTKTGALISATDVIRGTIALQHREGQMIKQERDMLGSILDLSHIEVKDVMLHRTHVEMLDVNLAAEQLVHHAVSTLHSRIPLWEDNPDNIIGVLNVKTLIKTINEMPEAPDNAKIRAIAVKPWFVPETTPLRDQLLAFRRRRQHLAFVVDEYGAWQGIITLEDIIEEIVGDIEDEHDESGAGLIQKTAGDAYLVAGGVTVRDVNRQLDWSLPEGEASTVAGLLIQAAEILPSPGEQYDIEGYRFTVLEKSAKRLTQLRIEKLPTTGHSSDGQ